MDKYIKQLLEQYSKVILPKFGAIVIEDEESGDLMFNEYLNYNDGKLDELIESESNMGKQEAQNMIAKYIRDIQAQIDKGESYDIFGLGSFMKNKDGEVEFSGNIKTGASKNTSAPAGPSPTAESSKKEEKSPEEKTDKKQEKSAAPKSEKKENKYVAPADDTKKEQSEPESKKEAKKQEEKTEKSEKKAVEKKQDSKADKDKAKKDKEAAKKKAKEDKEKAKKDKLKAKEDAKKAKADKKKKSAATKNKPDQKEEGKKKKKKVGVVGWIAIVLLLIVATGSILVGLNYEEVKSYMGWDEFKDNKELAHNDISPSSNETDKDDQDDEDPERDSGEDLESTSDEITKDSGEEGENEEDGNETGSDVNAQEEENQEEKEPVVEEPIKEEPVKETPVVTNTSSGSYHLIAGGYREKSNAEDAVSELKSKGLDAKIIGRINGLHFVSAKSYNSLNAAKQDMNNVRTKAPGAWIYKQ